MARSSWPSAYGRRQTSSLTETGCGGEKRGTLAIVRRACEARFRDLLPGNAMETIVPQLPRPVPQVMVSSTFTDLKEHRAALIGAIHEHGLHARVMETDSARLVDVIDSSL